MTNITIMIEEMLSTGFMPRALAAGALIGILCAILSVIINLKKLSFMGVGISHSAFGGLALGALFDVDLTLSALVFSTAVALLIGWMSRKGRIHEDISIGVIFAASMALGVACLGFMKGYTLDLFSFLFGSILAVTDDDLMVAVAAFIVVIALIVYYYKEFLVYCFDEEWARVCGVNVDRLQDLLLVMISITIVVSIKLLGIVLVSALLVIPGAIGFLLSENYRGMAVLSVVSALLSVVAGLAFSYRFDVASGASIVLSATFIFFLSAILTTQKK